MKPISGAMGMNAIAVNSLSQCTAPHPLKAMPAPANPPMRAWEELVGRLHHHVSRSHAMAPTSPASTTFT